MKKALFFIVVLLLSNYRAVHSTELKNGLTNKDGVKVRLKKDLKSKIIDTLKKCEVVQIVKKGT